MERVPRASWAAVCQEMAQLKVELASEREALPAILGGKVAFYDNGQVRATSQLQPRRGICLSACAAGPCYQGRRWRRLQFVGGPDAARGAGPQEGRRSCPVDAELGCVSWQVSRSSAMISGSASARWVASGSRGTCAAQGGKERSG